MQNLDEDKWNYYYNQDYGNKWHRGNRGDHVTGCTPRDWWVSAVDVNNMFAKRVVPYRNKFFENLEKLPGVTCINLPEGNAFAIEKGNDTRYVKFMGILQDGWTEKGWNLKDGFGAFVTFDKDKCLAEHLKDHPEGTGLIEIYKIPEDEYQGTLTAFKNWGRSELNYTNVIKENPKLREFLKDVLSEEAFNKFYHISTEKPKEEHKEVEVTNRGKAFVRDFWKVQKAVKQHEVNPLSYSDWEDLKAFLDTDEGYTAFGKYYNYAKKLVGSWLGESKELDMTKAMEILKESGIKIQEN